jgi:predicted nucleic acid-binding protein
VSFQCAPPASNSNIEFNIICFNYITSNHLSQMLSGQMELTVHPWRMGRAAVAREYETLLVHFPNLTLADVTRDAARRAAQLRARYNVRPADALQVATALVHKATAFVTNDQRLARLSPELDVIALDDFVVA